MTILPHDKGGQREVKMFNMDVAQENDVPIPGHDIENPNPGVALALGGGVARGWSHIGVLRAFDEANIPIKMIAGTSIGALVGGCYLAGKLDELEEFARELTPRRIVGFLDVSLRGSGLISGYRLAERMAVHLDGARIENLSKPLVCVATEISTGHEIWLSRGPLIDAIRASYALPGIFEPVRVGSRLLVDGALVNPVPVPVCRAFEADCVVSVNLSSDIYGRGTVVRDASSGGDETQLNDNKSDADALKTKRRKFGRVGKTMGVTAVMIESFNIIQDRIARSRLAGDPPDLSVMPKVGGIGLAEFHRAAECIDLGYEAAKSEVARLKDLASISTV